MEQNIHVDQSFKNLAYSGKETKNKEFEHCTFSNCDFSNGGFITCKFVDCVFTGCNLSMTKLGNCQLKNVMFKDSKLMGINFSECADFLFVVKFEGCILDYASFVRKKMTKTMFINTSMKSVDFSMSDLTKSVFTNTDLMNAVFNKSILREVDFVTAINYSIDPELNTIKKAIFSQQGIGGLLHKYDIFIE